MDCDLQPYRALNVVVKLYASGHYDSKLHPSQRSTEVPVRIHDLHKDPKSSPTPYAQTTVHHGRNPIPDVTSK